MSSGTAWSEQLDGETINSVAISANGSTIVTGTYFYNGGKNPRSKPVAMYAYDSTGRRLWRSTIPNVSGGVPAATAPTKTAAGIYFVAISPDGLFAASGGLQSDSQGFVYVYDVSNSGALSVIFDATTNLSPKSLVKMVALSGLIISGPSKGKYVLAAGADQLYISIGSGSTWVPKSFPTVPAAPGSPPPTVEEVAVSADGSLIVAAIKGGSLMVVENKLGVLTASAQYSLPSGVTISSIAVAADGSGFAAAGTVFSTSGTVYYFNAPSFFPPNPTPNPTPAPAASWSAMLNGCVSCRAVAISPDNSFVAAVGTVGSQESTATGKLFVFPNPKRDDDEAFVSAASAIAHSPNATSITVNSSGVLVAVSDGAPNYDDNSAFYLFTTNTSNQILALPKSPMTHKMNHSVQISAVGNGIVGGSENGSLYYIPVP